MILDLVIDNLKAEGLLQTAPRTHLALALSGGGDSTALLFLLHEIQSRYPLDVTAIYFNHGWRGNPPPELPLIHRNCLKCDVPLIIVQADRTLPRNESAARQLRYQQLSSAANDLRADALLTAHHADDQVETLIFRVLRGTGLDGLSGINRRLVLSPPHGEPVPILRPLLDVSRKRLTDYIADKKLEIFHDPTNDDTKIQRNNIRHQLLPALEDAFPQVKNALFRLSLVAEGDLRILEETIDAIWPTVYGEDNTGPYLEATVFNQLGAAYQRRILKRFWGRQGIHADFQSIEEALAFIRGEGRRNLDASLKSLIKDENGNTRFLSLYKARLRVIEEPADRNASVCVPVTTPGHAQLPDLQRTFIAYRWLAPEKVGMSPIRPNDSCQVYANLSAFLDKPLELRHRRSGDKFQPMGMDKPLRFKKFLINRGVPRFERNKLLVLASGDQILWAPGLGLSQQIRLQPKSAPTHLLCLKPGLLPEPAGLMDLPPEPEPESEKEIVKATAASSESIFGENALENDDLIMEDDE